MIDEHRPDADPARLSGPPPGHSSGEPPPGPDPDDEPGREPEHQGRISPTGPKPLVAFAVVGLVIGWSIRPICLRFGLSEPPVSFAAAGLLVFVAGIIGWSAYSTRRAVHGRRHELQPHQAVNRLVMGKAAALVGALVAGSYFGYALGQLGVADPQAHARLVRAAASGVAGIGIMAAALLLEHACRVPPDDD